MDTYLRIFNFLWRLKRVEFVLNATWSVAHVCVCAWSTMRGPRCLSARPPSSCKNDLTLAGPRRRHSFCMARGCASSEVHEAVMNSPSFRGINARCNHARLRMMHFVQNLQYYLMFEVLEASCTAPAPRPPACAPPSIAPMS